MKIRIYEITQTFRLQRANGIHICLFCFCCRILFISPALLPHVQNVMEQLLPGKDPFGWLWFGSHRHLTRVASLPLLPESGTERGRVHTTSPSLLLYRDTCWKTLFSLPHLCLCLSLCSCLLSVELSVQLKVWPWCILPLPMLFRQRIHWIYTI